MSIYTRYTCCEHCLDDSDCRDNPDDHAVPCEHGCNADENTDTLGSSNA